MLVEVSEKSEEKKNYQRDSQNFRNGQKSEQLWAYWSSDVA